MRGWHNCMVRSLTPNQKVQGSILSLVEGWTLGDLLSPHRPVNRDVKPLVWIVSQRSIAGLKRAHTLVDKRRLMPVLWTVTSSYKGAPLVESNLCGKPLPYAEKSCK